MSDHRGQPRRRGDQLVQAIYDAALAELAENGYAAATMDVIAQRARTGKASLYRRWPTRVDLIMDAIRSRMPTDDSMIDTGSLRTDLIAVFEGVKAELAGPVGIGIRGVLAESLGDEENRVPLLHHSRGSAMGVFRAIINRAAERGEVDASTISDRRLGVGPSILRYELLLSDGQVDVTELVDEVVLPLFTAGPTNRPRPRASRAASR